MIEILPLLDKHNYISPKLSSLCNLLVAWRRYIERDFISWELGPGEQKRQKQPKLLEAAQCEAIWTLQKGSWERLGARHLIKALTVPLLPSAPSLHRWLYNHRTINYRLQYHPLPMYLQQPLPLILLTDSFVIIILYSCHHSVHYIIPS